MTDDPDVYSTGNTHRDRGTGDMTDRSAATTVSHLLGQLLGQQNLIVIPRALIVAFDGDYPTAALCAQLIYWRGRTTDPDGWTYKTYGDWSDELALNDYFVRKATRRMVAIGFLTTEIRKVAGAPTLHYRLDIDEFSEWILQSLQIPFLKDSRNESARITDSTSTEITSETTYKEVSAAADPLLPIGSYVGTGKNPGPFIPAPFGASIVVSRTEPDLPEVPYSAPDPIESLPVPALDPFIADLFPELPADRLPESDRPHTMAMIYLILYGKTEQDVAPAYMSRVRGIMKRLLEQGIGSSAIYAYIQFRKLDRPDRAATLPDLGYLSGDVLQWDAEGRPERPAPRAARNRPHGEPVADVTEIRRALEQKRDRQNGGRS